MTATNLQRLAYREKFRSLYAEDFQKWFEQLAQAIHPNGDFQSIRNSQGDGGLDGFVINSQLVYQVYAPARMRELRDSATATKIREDFAKAVATLRPGPKTWFFVHNHPEGKIGLLSASALSDLKRQYPEVTLGVLGIDSLWELLVPLPESTLGALLGNDLPNPTRGDQNIQKRFSSWTLSVLLLGIILLFSGGDMGSPHLVRGVVYWLNKDGEKIFATGIIVREFGSDNPSRFAVTGPYGEFRLPIPESYEPGEQMKLAIDKPGWTIRHPFDGEISIPKRSDRIVIPIEILPSNSPLFLSHDQLIGLMKRLEEGKESLSYNCPSVFCYFRMVDSTIENFAQVRGIPQERVAQELARMIEQLPPSEANEELHGTLTWILSRSPLPVE